MALLWKEKLESVSKTGTGHRSARRGPVVLSAARLSKSVAFFLVLMVFAVPTTTALAQGGSSRPRSDPEAHSHFRVAETLYTEGRFVDAGAEFDKAYELSKKPQLLYNSYLAYRDAGMLDEAADRLRRYLDEGEVKGDQAFLRSRLDSLEAQIAERDEAAAKAVQQEQRLRDEKSRADRTEQLEAEEARRVAAAEEARVRRSRWIAIGIGGGGGALLIGGAVAGALALSQADAARTACPGGLCPFGFDVDSARSSVSGLALASDLLIGAGIAAAATGLVYWLVTRPKPEADVETQPVEATAFCLPGHCAASLSVRFQ